LAWYEQGSARGQAQDGNEAGGGFMTRYLSALLVLGFVTMAAAAPNPVPDAASITPHYVSQRIDKAYMREGPSFDHKVMWVYQHRGYPLLVTASFDVWRRVLDVDGTVGWMSAQMLSDKRTVLVIGAGRVVLHETDDPNSKIVGMAEKDAILDVKACERTVCHVYADGVDGWMPKERAWGVTSDEVFK
jgi:SH3-like domain-containing protein